jgi:hypothetical protein
MRGLISSTGLPITLTLPALGPSRPEMKVRVVDLPQPVGPTTAQNLPASVCRLMLRRAVYNSPVGAGKRLKTPCRSIAVAF